MLGRAVRQIRKEKGLDQTELADRIGSTQATISRWERWDGPPYSRIGDVANALGVQTWDIYRKADELAADEPNNHNERPEAGTPPA